MDFIFVAFPYIAGRQFVIRHVIMLVAQRGKNDEN